MIINTDELLRKYIPNVLVTVEGEQSLYEKLRPFLSEASDFIQSQITGHQIVTDLIIAGESSPLDAAFNRVLYNHAYLNAIPSLDLVLTPNGFGIVNNQNIAPASKERVERLMASIEKQRVNTGQKRCSRISMSARNWGSRNIDGRSISGCDRRSSPSRRRWLLISSVRN